MNKALSLCFCSSIIFQTFAATQHVSKTFMLAHPVNFNTAAEQSLWHEVAYNNDKTTKMHAQITPIYQQLSDSAKVERYFMPSDNTIAWVKGDSNSSTLTGTYIRAEWIGLPTTYNASFSLRPQYKSYGFLLDVDKQLKGVCSWKLFDNLWVGISIPFIGAESSVTVDQYGDAVVSSNTEVADIKTALSQSAWKYARFDTKKSRFSPAEVRFRIGTMFVSKKGFQLFTQNSVSCPLASRAEPNTMLYPQLGFNHHCTFGAMAGFQLPLTAPDNSYSTRFYVSIQNMYLIKNTQLRTFDLKSKPWSRYLSLRKRDESQTTPGVNILTQEVTVRPFNMVDLSTGLRIQKGSVEAEIGYNLWGHGTEELTLTTSWAADYGISGTGTGSASKSTIQLQATNDTSFTPIYESDIDLASGATQNTLTHKVHVSIGKLFASQDNFDIFFGLGGFFEQPHQNSAPAQWGAWTKMGATF